MINIRGIAVLFMVFVVVLAKRVLHQKMAARRRTRPSAAAMLPGTITAGRNRTWVLFTTPYCATCSKVEAQLAKHDPSTAVVRVDATRDTDLADLFAIKTAPTLLLAARNGSVLGRYVGTEAAVNAARTITVA